MAQIINTNLMSLNAQRNLASTQGMLAQSVQRLSTGLRINSAKDDAAGLAIAERMNTQVRGMNVAIRNANDAISLSQTAEGALSKINDMGQRMRELAVQSANATNSASDRLSLDAEFQQLSQEIHRTLASTKFNETGLFTTPAGGTQNAGAALTFQVGTSASGNDQITINTTDMAGNDKVKAVIGTYTPATSTAVASQTGNINIKAASDATGALDKIDEMLTTVNSERARYGALQNRFEAVISTLRINSENQSAARSRIMDADFSQETAALTRSQVLQQAGTAMLSQANSMPNNVLSLLR